MYVTVTGGCTYPFVYDSYKNRWSSSSLPALPYASFSLVTVPDRKQLLAIGGMVKNNGMNKVTNKVFLWDGANRKWTNPYPNMPTARCGCSSISLGSTVIVAGGVTCYDPWTMTKAVEVLHIKEHGLFTKSHWSVVEQLPHVVYEAIPLIVDDKLYIAAGYNEECGPNTCFLITASLPELLQSSNRNTSCSQVWNKPLDMPYSYSINHYQGRLITFSDHKVEQSDKDKPVLQLVPLIYIYNHHTRTWDCVGEIPRGYLLGRSVYIRENKFLFIGGLTGVHDPSKDNAITTCSILTLSPQ